MSRGRELPLRPVFEALLLSAAGAATGAAFLPGGPWWLLWISCVPLFLIAPWKGAGGALLSGWLFGTAMWGAGIYWLADRMSLFLQVPAYAGLVLFLGVCLWHGLMFGFAALVAAWGRRLLEEGLGWPTFAALLCTALPAVAAMEEFFPTLFPVYFASGLAAHLPAVQVLELTGPAGVTFLVLGFNVAAALFMREAIEAVRGASPRTGIWRYAALLAAAAALVMVNEGYGRFRIERLAAAAGEAGQDHAGVALIQAAAPLPPGGGGKPAIDAYLGLTRLAAREVSPDLVIWPESVYGRVARYRAEGAQAVFAEEFRSALKDEVPGNFSMLLNSRAIPEGAAGVAFNAAYSVDTERRLLGLSQKRRLFPFGEYMPMGRLLPALYKFSPRTASGIRAGAVAAPLPVPGGTIGTLICYEDLYPGLAAELVRKGAGALVELSNEEGFGTGHALRQHLALSSLRAVETRRYFLRAANTGISAVVDPAGRIVARLEPGQRSYLYLRLPLGGRPTFYSSYERFIRMAAPVLLLILPAAALLRRRYAAVERAAGGGN